MPESPSAPVPPARGLFPFRLPGFNGLSRVPVRDLFRFARRRLGEERLSEVASGLTFTTVLALVPVLTIALALFTAFPLFNTLRKTLEAYFVQNLMPKAIASTILGYLTSFANKATRLSAIGAVGLLVTALATMALVDRTFNKIWHVKKPRPWLKRLLVYWAIITLGPLLIGVSLSLTSALFVATGGVLGEFPVLAAMFYTLVPVLLTTAAYTLLYTAVPNRPVDWRDAACGGLLAAIVFEVAKRLFAVFISKFPTYTMIYGALAAVPLFLLWIYFSWLITLVGALVVAALPVIKYERWWHVPAPGGEFLDAMLVLGVLHRARARGDSAAVNTAAIRAKTRLGYDEMEALLEAMAAKGWVGKVTLDAPKRVQWGKNVSEGADSWVLLANPELLTVAEVCRLFVFSPHSHGPLARHVEEVLDEGLALPLEQHFARRAVEQAGQ